jgi:hypothetical protein
MVAMSRVLASRCHVRAILAVLCALVGALVFADAPAQAALTHLYTGNSFGPGGLGSGAFSNAQGVAVDQTSGEPSSGDVYVYDAAGAIYKFDSSGEPAEFSASHTNVITGVNSSGFDESEIAVDSSSSGPDKGDIYVASGGVVQVYSSAGVKLGELTGGYACGVAVDPSGNVYVGFYEGTVNKYTPVTNPVSDANNTSSLSGVGGVCNVAADAEGNVYVDSYSLGPVTKYGALQFGSLQAIGTLVDESGSTLAVDPSLSSSDVYVDERSRVSQYDPSIEPPRLVGYFGTSGSGALNGSYGIAVSSSTGDVYVANGNGTVEIFGPTVAAPAGPPTITSESSEAIGHTSATLQAQIEPQGGETHYHFEYGLSTSYGTSVPIPDGAIAAALVTERVSVSLTGLVAGAIYHFRVVATNPYSPEPVKEADQTFTTVPPALIAPESVSDVTAESATLHAQINPLGTDTRYHFQYGTSSCAASPSSCTDTPSVSGIDIGSGEEYQGVATHIQGLVPHTTYHYRVVATNAFGTSAVEQTFTTQQAGEELLLPDNRTWELVSPPNNNSGAAIESHLENTQANPLNGDTQASGSGGAIMYLSKGTIGAAEGNIAPEENQIFSTRGSAGWSSQTITTPTSSPTAINIGHGSEYRLFSPDLSLGLVEPNTATLLSSEATEGTIYLRDDASGAYLPLVTAANIPAGTTLNKPSYGYNVKFVGASPDLKHVVFDSTAALTSNAVKNGEIENLYEWTAGQLRLVSVLPNGTPADAEGEGAFLGEIEQVSFPHLAHAVSSDGSRVVWNNGIFHRLHLYMRDTEREETIQLDIAQGAPEPGEGEAIFTWASSDGSRVFFTDGQKLTADSTAGEEGRPDLYEFEVTSGSGEPLAGKLIDLTVDIHTGENATAYHVFGASEDGSYVYFLASGVLAPGAVAGAQNLYLLHDTGTKWTTAFVSTGNYNTGIERANARVSPNGRYFAFESLKGISLYDASTSRVVCVSCTSTGEESKADETSLPPWWFTGGSIAAYQPRYLSDGGRLFFDSSAALVPQDINGQTDVYEYEPQGVGNCASTSTTFSEESSGCLGLISSGTSDEESSFIDASENGNDVFFLTSERLTSQDHNTEVDMYDAHVCSEAAPCSEPAVAPVACTTTDSCRAAPSPQPGIFGASGSATFAGAGNLTPVASNAASKTRALTGAQKLAKALRACKRKRKGKRAACEAQARKRYASRSRAKRSEASSSLSGRPRR